MNAKIRMAMMQVSMTIVMTSGGIGSNMYTVRTRSMKTMSKATKSIQQSDTYIRIPTYIHKPQQQQLKQAIQQSNECIHW